MPEWKAIVVLTCLWLMACSPPDKQAAHFQTYLTRVAYVLEVPVPELTPPSALTPLPAQRDLELAIPRLSAGLLNALKLKECDVLGLVAEHNAPAGKSQSAAGQLAYHLQFQQGLMQCLSHTEDTELSAWLTELIDAKAPLLPRYFWNMIVAEPEVRAALSPGFHSLPINAQEGYQATLQAFSLFARLAAQAESYRNQRHNQSHNLSQNPAENPIKTPKASQEESQANTDTAELNQALHGLYKNPYLGELFYSLQASAGYLEQTNDFLAALDELNCQGANAIKAERLRNAMQHYYIKDIQAYLAQLDRQFVELAPLLAISLTPPAQETTPDTEHIAAVMADYRQNVGLGLNSALYVRYRALTLAHAKLWQRFLKRCELSPKRG